MKCPKCKSEMEEGYVMFQRGLFWSKEKRRFQAFDAEVLKSAFGGFPLGFGNVKSFRCRKCNLVISQY